MKKRERERERERGSEREREREESICASIFANSRLHEPFTSKALSVPPTPTVVGTALSPARFVPPSGSGAPRQKCGCARNYHTYVERIYLYVSQRKQDIYFTYE